MTSASFSDLQLAEPIQRAIQAQKYSTPTPIQAQAIPHLLDGRDLLGCAQTGTGKTAAFALPMLHHLETQRRRAVSGKPRMLVLSPTRELAVQIGNSFRTYGRHVRYRQTLVYGGVGQAGQVRALNQGAHLVIATPGRLLDLMNQRKIHLDQLEVFTLDEADRMLDMGFLPDLKRIIACLPKNRQSLFFTATLSAQIAKLSMSLLREPVQVDLAPKTLTVEKIEQRVLFVQQSDKQQLLLHLLEKANSNRALVFTRTKRGADRVARQLNQSGFQADAIHGNKSQSARERTLNGFRRGRFEVLVATDVAARGIDVDGITHVINYDMPCEPENYVHRIGRTARGGAGGIALSFCDAGERSSLRAIEKLIHSTIRSQDDHPFHVDSRRSARQKDCHTEQGAGGSKRWKKKSKKRATAGTRN